MKTSKTKFHQLDTILPGFAALDLRGGGVRDKRRQENGRAAHARYLPGKKSDFSDGQWHAVLFSHGLLRACFIAPEAIQPLRTYGRLREDHLEQAAMCVAHLQRAFDGMNVRLHTVISQLHGVSGLLLARPPTSLFPSASSVIEAILAGEPDPKALAALCDAQILKKHGAAVIEASLEGHWQEQHRLCASSPPPSSSTWCQSPKQTTTNRGGSLAADRKR